MAIPIFLFTVKPIFLTQHLENSGFSLLMVPASDAFWAFSLAE